MATRKFCAVDFAQEQVPWLYSSVNVATTGTNDNTTARLRTQQGHLFEVRYEQDNADITFVKDAQGWIIPNDNTNNEGIEITQGIQATTTPMSFTVATDRAFFLDVVYDIPAVADYDVAFVGFRTLAAYADAINDAAVTTLGAAYTNMYGVNVNQGDLFEVIATSDASIADTVTDTTVNWAAGEQNRIRVNVTAAGVGSIQYTVAGNGTATSTLTTYGTTRQLVSGQVLVPSLIFCKDDTAAADTPPILVHYRCGLL